MLLAYAALLAAVLIATQADALSIAPYPVTPTTTTQPGAPAHVKIERDGARRGLARVSISGFLRAPATSEVHAGLNLWHSTDDHTASVLQVPLAIETNASRATAGAGAGDWTCVFWVEPGQADRVTVDVTIIDRAASPAYPQVLVWDLAKWRTQIRAAAEP